VLVQVKDKRERSLPVRPPGVEKTSRLGSRDPVASGVMYGPHGGKNGKMKLRTISWLSHKTKVEPGLRWSQVMSCDWRRLHQVGAVCGGSPKNHRVTRLSHKAEDEDRAWLSGQNRPDRFVKLVPPVWGCKASGDFKVEHTRRGRKACIEAKRSAVAGHPSDGVTTTISQSALGGRVS
jgi:hypothetical protein